MSTLVGLTIFSQTTTDWDAGQTFNSYTGRPFSTQFRKVYVDTWPPPGSVQGDLLGNPGYIHSGTRLWLCYKPPYRTSTGSYNTDYAAMKTDINAYIAAFNAAGQQVKIKICLWQEVNNPAHLISAAQYLSIMQFYYPKLHADYPTHPVCFDASGSYSATAAGYYPKSGGTVYCDEAGMDLYCTRFYKEGQHSADAVIAKAAADGIPFGFPEIGASLPGDTLNTTAQFNSFILDYVLPNTTGSDVGWYDSHHTNPGNDVTGPDDYKVPALQALFDALQPGRSAIAQITGTFSLTANGQVAGGTTKFASATVRAAFSLSANGSAAGRPAALIQALFTLTTGGGASGLIVQQVQGTATYDYGSSGVEITTQPGNTLLVLAGWDLSTSPVTAPMPAVNVTDSAANLWDHVATSGAGVTGSRCSAWICSNAQAIEWLSVSLTTFASSLAYLVLELDGTLMPPYFSLDVLDSAASAEAASLTLNPGVTSGAGFGFAVLATGGYTGPPTVTGASWQALPSVLSGPRFVPYPDTTQNSTQIFPFIATAASGENLATTFTISQPFPASAVVFGFPAVASPPYQPNPNFPVLKVEAGFGATPGDPSQAPPAWTDITSRVMGPEGQAWVTVTAGRQYELATAEAGTMEIWLSNQDGAFTPGNVASPFYPGIVLGTPVRVSAWWNGQWYAIGYGWTERLPQAWPDLPQWGIVKMVAHDAIAVASAETMVSALNGDLLIDAPYVLLPANEQYLSFSNGLNSFGGSGTAALGYYSVADAQGLLAQNYSRTNQRAGVYVDGNAAGTGGSSPAIAATGQTTNLLGSSDTGFGTSSITTAPTVPASGPGIIYTDPGLPGPVTGNGVVPGADTGDGVTVTFWVIIPPPDVTSTLLQPVVFTAYGPPSSYQVRNPSLQVQVLNYTGSSTLQVTLADGSTADAPFSPSATPQQVTLTITGAQLSVYINAALQATAALTAGQVTTWNAVTLGCPSYAYQSASLVTGSFTCFDLAIYPFQLPVQRDVSHYATGISGQQGCDAVTRMGQILSWAGIGLARGGRLTFNGVPDGVTQGPAYSLAGATQADAVSQAAANHSAQIAATPTGALVFYHKWALFNQAPVAVLGDAVSGHAFVTPEIPYLQTQAWGYDDQYLYNLVQATWQVGANNLFTATAADFGSQASYFPRTALAQTITTTSAQDATDGVNWQIAKYSQPGLRVSGVTVDASSNPQAAFPVVLPLLQSQVVTVTRRPVGGAVISQNVIIQKITHSIGASTWSTAVQLSPYSPEDAVLQLDATSYDTVGSATLA